MFGKLEEYIGEIINSPFDFAIRVQLGENARIPSYGFYTDAGSDLYSAIDTVLPPHQRVLVPTNTKLEIPKGYYGRIAPRSGLALKHGIDILAGVIDSSYRGDVGVILYNTDSTTPFPIQIGDRIAQLIIERYYRPNFLVVDELNQTERASGGFGSTGA